MTIRNEGYGIAEGQSPSSRGVNAELCVHAAYNDARHLPVVYENSFQFRPKERIGRRLANPDIGCRDIQAGGELPRGCAVL